MTSAPSMIPLTRQFPADWVRAADSDEVSILGARRTPMRWLVPVEFATLHPRVHPARRTDHVLSVSAWASQYLHERAEFGTLDGRSAWSLAESLQDRFIRYGPRARDPWRGLDVLRLVDADSARYGVEFWLGAAPSRDDWTHYRPMRLSTRLEELGWAG